MSCDDEDFFKVMNIDISGPIKSAKRELLEEIKQSVEDGNDWDTVIDEHLKELE